MTACCSNDKNTRILWFYESDRTLPDADETAEWTPYSDFESEYIEEAFQRNEECIQLNEYVIDLKNKVQLRKDKEDNGMTSVKRESVSPKNYVRQQRFSSHAERAILKTFILGREWYKAPLLDEWRNKNENIRENSSVVAEMAAQGILIEGKLVNKEFDAQRMAEKLRNCRNNETEILNCAVRLYSATSFLFSVLNEALMNEDISKADTLGPITWLLNSHIAQNGSIRNEEFVVYRGATLNEEMIREYLEVVGKEIVWRAFTSTSKSRSIAEIFSGNVLFIIKVQENSFQRRRDISSISIFPDEEEILLTANYVFNVEKIQQKETKDGRKYLIYMTGCGF